MTDFTIHIEAPELAQAIQALAGALGNRIQKTESVQTAQAPAYSYTRAPMQPSVAEAAPQATAPAVTTAPIGAHAAPVSAAPVAVPAPVVQTAPVAAAPQYTPEMIQLATAPLIDAGKGEQLKGLLAKYGVMRVSDIPANALGAFATDLRAMGARI